MSLTARELGKWKEMRKTITRKRERAANMKRNLMKANSFLGKMVEIGHGTENSHGRLPPSGSDARAAAKAAKKVLAQTAKEEAREKRKTKLSKHLKKKATKGKGQGNKSK